MQCLRFSRPGFVIKCCSGLRVGGFGFGVAMVTFAVRGRWWFGR